MQKRDTRSDIIGAGTELIALQGFNATGIDAVLKRAEVPKGSFYHFFSSKEDFGVAVIDAFGEKFLARLASFLDDPAHPPLARIRRYLEGGLDRLELDNCARGCLIGNLGQEMAGLNERFRARLEEVFDAWKGGFAACIRAAQAAGEAGGDLDPDAVAGFVLSGFEGSILRAKVTRSPQPVRQFIDILFTAVLAPPQRQRC
jgi:TetR/AcrR family transcriptional regulator, transcriptional repressor for nem operon